METTAAEQIIATVMMNVISAESPFQFILQTPAVRVIVNASQMLAVPIIFAVFSIRGVYKVPKAEQIYMGRAGMC